MPCFLHAKIFILSHAASVKSLLSLEENMETIEGAVNSLITRLIRRMIYATRQDGMEISPNGSIWSFYIVSIKHN